MMSNNPQYVDKHGTAYYAAGDVPFNTLVWYRDCRTGKWRRVRIGIKGTVPCAGNPGVLMIPVNKKDASFWIHEGNSVCLLLKKGTRGN